MELFADIIGTIGTGLIVVAYFILQKGTMKGDDWGYLWLNLIGAIMLLYSLFWSWNTPSVIIEIFWIGISVYGMGKKLRTKNEQDITT